MWGRSTPVTTTRMSSEPDDARPRRTAMSDDTPLAEQRCVNCGSTELHQDTNGLWHCDFCRSTFRADDPEMIVVDSPNVQEANELVIDTADMLTFDQQEALTAHLRGIRDRDDVVIAVETVNTITENVEYYARKRAQELGVGDEAKDNGIYILLVRSPRRIQVQAGNGISTFLNSDDINAAVRAEAVPRFRADDMLGGLTAVSTALVHSYLDNRAMKRTRTDSRSSGGAGRSRSPIGSAVRQRFGGISGLRYVPLVLVMTVVICALLWGEFHGGFSGGGSGYDSDSGSWDSGSWDSGGGSDFGGGSFDSGSGGGSDW